MKKDIGFKDLSSVIKRKIKTKKYNKMTDEEFDAFATEKSKAKRKAMKKTGIQKIKELAKKNIKKGQEYRKSEKFKKFKSDAAAFFENAGKQSITGAYVKPKKKSMPKKKKSKKSSKKSKKQEYVIVGGKAYPLGR